eukprot:TRINITY_DN20846_c1_g2_i2.p1 TRINITY_DN20846_c1_g2~~TRINITY_DN20846_c1_g2_i2.p1  ORF type:complete len:261 (-),score=6.14 TRINITY_DN20846_c1_g2_i2:224-1006(-)
MEQHRLSTGKRRRVRRIDVAFPEFPFPVPESWDSLAIDNLRDVSEQQLVKMQRLLQSYAHPADSAFPSSICPSMCEARVKRVWQVQNAHLWQRFCAKKMCIGDCMQRQGTTSPRLPSINPSLLLDPSVNEVFAFHGTTRDVAKTIAREGFDERVSKNGLYGQGLYFTPQSCKAMRYALQDDSRSRWIILSRVVLGVPHTATVTNRNLRRPPEFLGSSPADSIVASPGDLPGAPSDHQFHTEFVLFDGTQAFPEYLIEFAT